MIVGRDAEVPDLAVSLQLLDRLGPALRLKLLHGRAMQHVQVDRVPPQPLEAVLGGSQDRAGLKAPVRVVVRLDWHAAFGGDDRGDGRAAGDVAEDRFAASLVVAVRGVEERDAEVEGASDDWGPLRRIDAGIAEAIA